MITVTNLEYNMNIKFIPANLSQIAGTLTQHLTTLSSPVDTFFEEHIQDSTHYQIVIDDAEGGYTSIHDGTMIVQFCLYDPFKRYGQAAFQRAKKLETVQRALVPTCDEFFLSHALDAHRLFEMQAYTFQVGPGVALRDTGTGAAADLLSFRRAEAGDAALIRQESETFFDPIEERIERGELFITYRQNECAGFGIMVPSHFVQNRADVGMFTRPTFRNAGVGTATIRLLLAECRRRDLQAVAGCWYYNHFSKQTLEKAGMFSQTRLLKISY